MKEERKPSKTKYFIELAINRWKKSSQNLYDYEEQFKIEQAIHQIPIEAQTLNFQRLSKTAIFTLVDKDSESTKNEITPAIKQLHLRIEPDWEQRKIKLSGKGNPAPGLVVKYLRKTNREPKGYPLQVGNEIVFGKVSFFVDEMRKSDNTIISAPVIDHQMVLLSKAQKESEDFTCRVCFDNADQLANPMIISPCKCHGSCKWIHVKCLRQWISIRQQKIERQYAIILTKINCEICKAKIPWQITIKGVKHQLVRIPRPQNGHYIMLHKLNQDTDQQLIILKKFPEEGITFGRDGACYVLVKDISVTRVHARFSYCNGEFLLFDNASKFGTTVKNDSGFTFNLGKVCRAIQMDDCLFSFRIRNSDSCQSDTKSETTTDL